MEEEVYTWVSIRKLLAIGMAVHLAITASAVERYVDVKSSTPFAPYTNWQTAAVTIQDAVDAAQAGDTIIVSNGVYRTGGRAIDPSQYPFIPLTNRVAVTKPLILRSVNGPSATVIEGNQVPVSLYGTSAVRCIYLSDGAALIGFTLTNGATLGGSDYRLEFNGGGAWCQSTNARLTNCVIIGNAASFNGGGAMSGTLIGCTLIGNRGNFGGGGFSNVLYGCTLSNNAARGGGGAANSILENCTLVRNTALISGNRMGGGAYDCALKNCILSSNVAGDGGGARGGTLDGCIVSNNVAENNGGGTFASIVRNCTLIANAASSGGGAAEKALYNCVLLGNVARIAGGGMAGGEAYGCVALGNSANIGGGLGAANVVNCTVVGNVATNFGGGVPGGGSIRNSIIYYNYASNGADIWLAPNSRISNSCSTLLPNAMGNITNAPLFVDVSGGNLRLQSNSPCINSGRNADAPPGLDVDGNPRIIGGTVDMGAFEYSMPASIISYAWLQRFGLPTDGSIDFVDTDSDRMNNWQEWRAQTHPTNAASVLRLISIEQSGANIELSWQSVEGLPYVVERSPRLEPPIPFSPIGTNVVGQPDTTSYSDTNTAKEGRSFYRIRVQE